MLVVNDAFCSSHYKGEPVLGGLIGGVIVAAFGRASFSNEAGIGTAPWRWGIKKSRTHP